MNEEFFKDLGKSASDAFVSNATPLNESVTKLAKQHNLNADQIARVCEAANLSTYTKKMANASDRLVEFELADKTKVAAGLSIQMPSKPIKHASEAKDIAYYVKSAAMKDESQVFAPEYSSDGRFLNTLAEPCLDEITITKIASEISSKRADHSKVITNRKAMTAKMAMAKKLEELSAEQMSVTIKLANSVGKVIDLIKQSAVSSNPFIIWRDYDKSDDSPIIDKLFIKAAEGVIKFNEKRAKELLLEAKRFEVPEHDAYLKERKVKIINHDPIIHEIDNITNFRKILDKIEDFKSNDGIFEKSTTPQPSVEHTIDKGQSAIDWHDKLTGRK